MGIALRRRAFLDIADIEDGLGRQQLRLREQACFFVIARLGQARRLAIAQQFQRLPQHGSGGLRLLVALRALLQQIGHALFQAFQIGQHQFRLDRLGVGDRVDLALDMGDVVILETAQHMDDGVGFADIGQELVDQPFALGRAPHQAGNVDKRQLRLDDLLRPANLRDRLQPGVRHSHAPLVRFDRAEGIIRRLRRLRFGQRIEQGGLAHIGKPDDTATKTHLTAFTSNPMARPIAVSPCIGQPLPHRRQYRADQVMTLGASMPV